VYDTRMPAEVVAEVEEGGELAAFRVEEGEWWNDDFAWTSEGAAG